MEDFDLIFLKTQRDVITVQIPSRLRGRITDPAQAFSMHSVCLNCQSKRILPMSDEWIERLAALQQLLTVCPTDILTRCQLALLLEQLDQHEEALFNWKAVLDADPNNLRAREGVTRCRARTGRPLQSKM